MSGDAQATTSPDLDLDLDDEPRDVHALSCAVWNSNDGCDCATDTPFDGGVQAWIDRFDSYAIEQPGRAS